MNLTARFAQPSNIIKLFPTKSHSLLTSSSSSVSSLSLYSLSSKRFFATNVNYDQANTTSTNSFRSAGTESTQINEATQKIGNLQSSYGMSFIDKLQGANQIQLFHYSHIALLAGLPVALLLSPSIINMPIDLALGLIIPYHAHIGMVNVVEDYVPRPYRPIGKGVLLLMTVLTTFGILKINLCGAGITESIKALWRETPINGADRANGRVKVLKTEKVEKIETTKVA